MSQGSQVPWRAAGNDAASRVLLVPRPVSDPVPVASHHRLQSPRYIHWEAREAVIITPIFWRRKLSLRKGKCPALSPEVVSILVLLANLALGKLSLALTVGHSGLPESLGPVEALDIPSLP